MTGNYATAEWQYPKPARSFSEPSLRTVYETATNRESSSARVHGQLVERLLTDCGSGSRRDSVFAGLKEQIVSDTYTGDWTVHIFPSAIAVIEAVPPTMVEKLGTIRDAFGLSAGSLADILKASRASVYNWLEHELPTERFTQRIDQLYSIAKKWESMNVYHYPPGKLMKQKLGDGPSIQDRLRREVLDTTEISKGLEDLLALMRNQREKIDHARIRSSKAQGDTASQKEILERITGSITSDE